MNNTFIENKLKEFDDRFTPYEYEILNTINVKDFIKQSLIEAYSQGQTDYHNHIVEKIDTKINNCYTPSGFGDDAVRGWTRKAILEEIKSLLQDTNK